MPKRSSAYYQRQYRERLRAQGLVKKEVWILPDFAKSLSAVEELLREESTALSVQKKLLVSGLKGKDKDLKSNKGKVTDNTGVLKWTTDHLFTELLAFTESLHVSIELLDDSTNSPSAKNVINADNKQHGKIIHITMQEYGDLPLFMTVQGEQIIVETILCIADEIKDVDDFNKTVLKTHKYFPLSTISIDTLVMDNDDKYDAYQMFGSLQATASLQTIMLEIYMLTTNVMQALEAYNDCFKTEV